MEQQSPLLVVQTELDYWLVLGGTDKELSRQIQAHIDEVLGRWFEEPHDIEKVIGHYLPTLEIYYKALRELEGMMETDEGVGR